MCENPIDSHDEIIKNGLEKSYKTRIEAAIKRHSQNKGEIMRNNQTTGAKNAPQAKTDTSPRMFVSTPNEWTDKKTGEVKTAWTTIGSAFEGEKGITVLLNALPMNGKLFIGESTEQ